MKTTIITTVILLIATVALGQGVAINETGAAPHESAMLDISSTSKGLLIPRLNNTQMTTLSNAAIGLLVYNTDLNCFYFRNMYGWQKILNEGNNHTIYDADGMSYLSFMSDPVETDTLRIFFDDVERYRFSAGTMEVLNNNQSVYIGKGAGMKNTDGHWNTAVGNEALFENTIGISNAAFGHWALRENISGQRNVALGPSTLYSNTTGSYNTTAGAFTMRFNTTGDYNSAFGRLALWQNVSGSANTAVGAYALMFNVTGDTNTALGYNAGRFTEGSRNILIGYNAGQNITTGSYNIVLGDNAEVPSGTADNQLVIGDSLLLYGDISNKRIGIGTSNPKAILHTHGTGDGEGNVLFVGDFKLSPGDPPATGPGTRMMWYPDKAAFRVGHVTGTHWDKDSIGGYSVAMGLNATASGKHSMAMGSYTKALGDKSTAMGSFTTASGLQSTAIGYSTKASGITSTAIGWLTNASGDYSTAMGDQTTASGYASTTMGYGTTASGSYSTAMGYYTKAMAWYSTAIGVGTTASGERSTAMGTLTIAKSAYETVIGRYNTIDSNADSANWNTNDRLFVIGNGTASNARSNAMVVLKNGNTGLGTSTPTAQLHTTTGVRFEGLSAATETQAVMIDGTGNLSRRTLNTVAFNGETDPTWSGTANTTSDISRTGNVGIGTSNPNSKLHINSASGDNALRVQVGGVTKLLVSSNGGLGIGNPILPPVDGLYVHGDVGIGTSTPAAKLHVNVSSGTAQMLISGGSTSGNLSELTFYAGSTYRGAIGSNNFLNYVYIYQNGNIYFKNGRIGIQTISDPTFAIHLPDIAADISGRGRANAWTTYSDARVKSNQAPIAYGLKEIMLMEPVRYFKNNSSFENGSLVVSSEGANDIGFIAQDIYRIIPEIVNVPADENTDLWGMNYEKLTPVLVKAIQEQQAMIEMLKKRIEMLEEEK